MKKFLLSFIFSLTLAFFCTSSVKAVQFEVLVLPVDIFSVCDNYFCFPEVSNIIAEDVIENLNKYNNINVESLSVVRAVLYKNNDLKLKTEKLLDSYKNNDKVDFSMLKEVANLFGVKSIVLINSYAINDKTTIRRSLWDILEISSAFRITYPFELKTNAILTDCVNNIIMWSGKYSKSVSDSFGYYSASNQMQAMSQLEKIQIYSSEIVSKNISQGIFMRFFPKEVRTFTIKQPKQEDDMSKKFIPNALEHISDPHLLKEFDTEADKKFRKFGADDFIFEF